MPILVAILVNSGLVFGIFYLIGFDYYTKLFDDIELIPFFLGVMYLVGAQLMGGMVRATCGLSLIIMSAIDLGLSESENSFLQAAIALIGALTPL